MVLRQPVSTKVYRVIAMLLSLALFLQASPVAAGPDLNQSRRSEVSQPVANHTSEGAIDLPVSHATPQPIALARSTAHERASANHPLAIPAPLAQFSDSFSSQRAVATPVPEPVASSLSIPSAILPPVLAPAIPTHYRLTTQPSSLAAPLLASSIPLAPGWNLISIPEIPADTAPASVLASIAGSFDLVYAYNGCDPTDHWKLYDPSAPVASDLTAIDHTLGLWIHMTAAATLQVAGVTPTSTAIPLCTGWNLIGLPWSQPLPLAGALYSITGKYSRVFGYEQTNVSDPWAVFTVGTPGYANDLHLMTPGRGYWVLASDNVSATFSGPPGPLALSLSSHADGSVITSPITVTGRITSTTLAAWVMEKRSKDDGEWTTFGSGDTSASSQPQAQFDPTLLLNGIYEVRLTATDLFGQTASVSADVVLEGAMKIGLFTISFTDLAIPVVGVPIQVIRTYDSRDKRQGDFGVGWTLSIVSGRYTNNRKPGEGWLIKNTPKTSIFPTTPCSISQETKSHITEIRFSDVDFYRFAFRVQMSGYGSAIAGGCLGQASFVQIGGRPGATLQVVGDSDVFWQNGSNQLLNFDTFQTYEPGDVLLTTADGSEFELSLADGVERIRDRNGNALTISAGGITHSSGKSVAFTRDVQGRITRITDPMGDSLTYAYDGHGDLVSMTNQDGNTTRFTYNSLHYLLDIVDPRGVTPAHNEYDTSGRLVAVVDTNGKRMEFNHNLDARRETIQDRLGNVTIVAYDERGNVTSRIDPLGNETRYSYDARDNMLTETDALGRMRTLTYDSNDNVLSETNFDGDRVTLAYNTRNQVVTYADDRGRTSTNAYDANGNLTQSSDGVGTIVQYTYDAVGNARSLQDPLGNLTLYTYDRLGNQTSIVDPLGYAAFYAYDARNRPTSTSVTTTLPSGSVVTLQTQHEYSGQDEILRSVDALGYAFTTQMNQIGIPAATTDKEGNVVRYEYDALGHLSKMIYADESMESYTYDAEGRKLSQTDRDGHTTHWEYDALGRPVRTTYPDSASTTVTYDAIGRIVIRTDERGNTTTYGFAPHTEVVTDTLGNVTVSQYDSDGNLVRLTDATGYTMTYEYDLGGDLHGRGRPITTSFPDGTSTHFTFDVAGQKIAQTDQAGRQTQYGYDAAGRLILVTDALGQQTRYTYDSRGNLTSHTDANGHTTRLEYDGMNHLIRRTLPLSQTEMFGYNAQGQVATHTDFNGQTITYTYNSNHRLVELRLPEGSAETYAYTPDGLRTNAAGDSFVYDTRGRLLNETKADGAVLAYTYDAAGNRTSVTTPQGQVAYIYDPLNRLETVTDPQGGVTRYTYDAMGNLSRTEQPNGTVTTYSYDLVNRVSLIEIRTGNGALLASYAYIRNAAGHAMSVVEAPSGRGVNYTYDALYRLTSETVTDTGQPAQTTVYTYDAVGNRLSKQSSQGTTTYTYDANDRLTHESDANGEIIYGYDDNGNLVHKSGPGIDVTYQYDSRNRLILMRSGADEVAYTYDADGNRIRRVVNGTEITNFLVDKNGPLSQVLLETDGQGVVLASYVYGNDLISMQRVNQGTYYYHYDEQMSTRYLTDAHGMVSETYTYDALGNLFTSIHTVANPYLFTGEQYDPHLGLYYLRARYYSDFACVLVSI